MIGIIGAMDEEISAYLNILEYKEEIPWNRYRFYTGLLNCKEVVIVKSGVGKVLSAMITQKMIDSFPVEHIIFTGIAGSLNPDYEIGDIVVARDTALHDMDARGLGFGYGEIPYSDIRFVHCDIEGMEALSAASRKTQAGLHAVYTGRILTGDVFLTDRSHQNYSHLVSELSGDAVEMEGASTGIVSLMNNIPFNLLRIISDKADGNAPGSFQKFLKNASKTSLEIILEYTSVR